MGGNGCLKQITIHERPEDANNRTRIGDWEADTVAGKTGKACLVTLTNRYSRFLKIQKVAVKKSKLVIEAMVKMLEPLTKHTVTPDRGKKFTYHQKLSDQLKIEVYFPDPYAPWQRGTNENTNGLPREYFPKGSDLTLVDRKSHEYKAIKRYGKFIQQNSRKLSDKRFYLPTFRMHLTNKEILEKFLSYSQELREHYEIYLPFS